MFSIDTRNRIYLTKGDNAELTIEITDKDNNIRPNWEDDTIVLTVRKGINKGEAAITKTAVNGVFSFVPEDTNNLETGNYVYDIQLNTFTGKIYTVVLPSDFVIGEEVSK